VTQAIHVVTKENKKYYGVSGAFSIYNISVARGKRSATNVWVRTGSADETDLLIAGYVYGNAFETLSSSQSDEHKT
jgi:hypothetical protein